jgi:hypothetical protein
VNPLDGVQMRDLQETQQGMPVVQISTPSGGRIFAVMYDMLKLSQKSLEQFEKIFCFASLLELFYD